MDQAKRVVIDIVTWNALAYLPDLFASLDTFTERDHTITIIDNASNDGTVKWLNEQRPDVTVLRNFRNQGFGRAHDQAIAMALTRWPEADWAHRYVLVANPDLEFAADALSRLVAAMEADPELAACAPKILRAVVSSVGDDGRRETEQTDVLDAVGLAITKSRRVIRRGAGEKDAGQYDAQIDIFGATGDCALFRASALASAKLGGEVYDAAFQDGFEDADLAWRMRRLGMRTSLVPDALVWRHRPVGTAKRPRISARGSFLLTRNRIWMAWKNDEFGNRLLHAPWLWPLGLLRLLSLPFRPSVLKGTFAAFGGWSAMHAKRAELAKRAKVSGPDMRKWYV